MVKAMLAKEYNLGDPKVIVEGMIASEKLDGYRAIYEGGEDQFMSRQEKPFNSPEWFTMAFRNESLMVNYGSLGTTFRGWELFGRKIQMMKNG